MRPVLAGRASLHELQTIYCYADLALLNELCDIEDELTAEAHDRANRERKR